MYNHGFVEFGITTFNGLVSKERQDERAT